MTKKCFKCGQEKDLSLFYKHPAMGDGHLNKCIDCAKRDVRDRYETLVATDESFVASERLRGRDKYHRLYSDQPNNPEVKKRAMGNYRNRYPEKTLAKTYSDNIPCPEGFQKHHWSYNESDYRDVIIVTTNLHYKLHRFITYDPKEKKYRTTENTLLETREMHEKYITVVKELF